MATKSATSTTSSERNGTIKAYAGLRVAGDQLAPDHVTRILKVVPRAAYAKGQHYSGGPCSPDLIGRTGVWYFCTDGIVAGNKLSDHLAFLERLLHGQDGGTAPLQSLQKLMQRQSLHAVVSCFWHGGFGAKRPSLPRSIIATFKMLPATVETDFDVDEQPGQEAA